MGDRIVKRLIRERFLFSLRNGEAFDGLLIEADDKTFRLANVAQVSQTGRRDLDGDLFIPRGDVVYLQKPR